MNTLPEASSFKKVSPSDHRYLNCVLFTQSTLSNMKILVHILMQSDYHFYMEAVILKENYFSFARNLEEVFGAYGAIDKIKHTY